jgi:hypothetical protein
MKNILLIMSLAFMLAACAPTPPGQLTPARSSRIITAWEIASSSAGDALQAIKLLRPQWLAGRGSNLRQVVYVNNVRYGGVSGGLESLVHIPAATIQTIEYLNAMEATTFFGANHSDGAILITTR